MSPSKKPSGRNPRRRSNPGEGRPLRRGPGPNRRVRRFYVAVEGARTENDYLIALDDRGHLEQRLVEAERRVWMGALRGTARSS